MKDDKQVRISAEDYGQMRRIAKVEERTIKTIISRAINFFVKKRGAK